MKGSEFKGWQRVLLLILPYTIVLALFQFVGIVVYIE
jgi:hypothetical protein